MAEEDYEAWFERTLKEREDAISEVFGPSHPPGCPPDQVLSISLCGSGDHEVLIPGACVAVCPPQPGRRNDWAYVTVGLSQPAEPEDRPWDVEQGPALSGHGREFAILLPSPADWAGSFLAELMGYTVKASPLGCGHRFPFGLYTEKSGNQSWFVGFGEDLGVRADGDIRALLFWPYLQGPRWFTTDTGNFQVLTMTAITVDEWEYAKATSSPHLQLLLQEAGIGQTCLMERTSLLKDDKHRRRAEGLKSLSRDEAEALLTRKTH
ncbi:MAG: suppressor of fused domain protein [Planctomycetes bacterium]|nr:suppressor of fused domain protein [Planctomycetota bacterium]